MRKFLSHGELCDAIRAACQFHLERLDAAENTSSTPGGGHITTKLCVPGELIDELAQICNRQVNVALFNEATRYKKKPLLRRVAAAIKGNVFVI